jgi:hypothetical protein
VIQDPGKLLTFPGLSRVSHSIFMTVSAPFTSEKGQLNELILIACLVTDKKFRKIGGSDGQLQAAASKAAPNVLVKQVQPKDLLHAKGTVTESLLKTLLHGIPAARQVKLKIVHKFNDFSEREDCAAQMDILETWLVAVHDSVYDKVHIKVFDPLPCIKVFYDRSLSGRFIQNFCVSEGFAGKAFWPQFWSPAEVAVVGCKGPLIVKPVDACSKAESHWMKILKRPSPEEIASFPSDHLFQQFLSHFGVFYKIYVVGSSVNVVPRPSVSLTAYGEDVISFNTAHFKASHPDLREAEMQAAWSRFHSLRQEIERFALLLAERLNCSYFGVDVIIPEEDVAQFAVIDINYLPGFDGVEELPRKFIEAILKTQ